VQQASRRAQMFWCLYDRVIRISCSQCSRVHTTDAISFITSDGEFRILIVAYEHNSTVAIADSRLRLAGSVPLAKATGWIRPMAGMRVTSFDEGIIDTGN
jgi:hypothetical protein